MVLTPDLVKFLPNKFRLSNNLDMLGEVDKLVLFILMVDNFNGVVLPKHNGGVQSFSRAKRRLAPEFTEMELESKTYTSSDDNIWP